VPRHLVIVESPAKARTLGRLLGREYTVLASFGHVRDLPSSRLAVDPARGFSAEYEVLPARRRVLTQLRAAAREAQAVYLAADPDREGEAICWHLSEELAAFAPAAPFHRVSFHEITAQAVAAAFRAPGEIDRRRVDAQQTRRILDRLVGYSLSPLLWERVQDGLSAGRVQSAALRLVCDRERAIAGFVPEESWTVAARLRAGSPPEFVATLVSGEEGPLRCAAQAEGPRRELEQAELSVRSVTARERRRPAPPPFVTSTLQQEAFRRLRFAVKKTMQLAQRLYEGVELGDEGPVGLITYMRTDSTHVSAQAAAAAREAIASTFGREFLPARPNAFPAAPAAQEAHEAIRPSDVARTPDSLVGWLGRDELALYTLVFERFLASQMAPALYDDTVVEIAACPPPPEAGAPRLLRARGSRLRSPGFLALQAAAAAEPDGASQGPEPAAALPPLAVGEPLVMVAVQARQRLSEPPPRFDEASLVKELERRAIGRPSTYGTILETLLGRDYVERDKGKLRPTPLGAEVTELLVARFPELLSVGYTAAMEEKLDAIAEGRATLLATLDEFWRRLQAALQAARVAAEAPVAQRRGPQPTGLLSCPRCHSGRVVERTAEERVFFGCSRYPACRFTSSHRPLAESCPECGSACLYEKHTRREGRVVYCGNQGCHYHR